MGLAIRMAVAVTPPVVIGVLVWWGVMLAAPVVLVRRWRRRRRGAPRRRLWPPVARRRRRRQPRRLDQRAAVWRRGTRRPARPGSLTLTTRCGHPSARSRRSARRHRRKAGPRTRVLAVAGLSAETLEPLCRYVDFRRRLELAVIRARAQALRAARRSVAGRALPADRRAPQHAAAARRDRRVRDQRDLRARALGRRDRRQQARAQGAAAAARLPGAGAAGDLPPVHVRRSRGSGTVRTRTARGWERGCSAATR